MKALLEFNLPEDDEDFYMCVNANKSFVILQEMSNLFRRRWKHEECKTSGAEEFEAIRQEFFNFVQDQNLELW